MFDPVTAIIGSGLISGGLGLAGAGMQAGAAESAADQQAQAARDAAAMQQQQYQQTRQDLAPWTQAGGQALGSLQGMLPQLTGAYSVSPEQFQALGQGLPQYQQFGVSPESYYQQANQPFQFDPATDPGYQARLQGGIEAIEGGAAARGGLFSGQTGKELTTFGQDLAAQEYQQAFARDLATKQQRGQAYGQAAGQHMAQQQMGFGQDLTGRQFQAGILGDIIGRERGQRGDIYNMFSGVAGMGQQAAGQTAGYGQQAAGAAGQALQQGAAAQGAGGIGQAQAWAGGLQNIGNQFTSGLGSLMNYQMMQNMLPQSTYGPAYGPGYSRYAF